MYTRKLLKLSHSSKLVISSLNQEYRQLLLVKPLKYSNTDVPMECEELELQEEQENNKEISSNVEKQLTVNSNTNLEVNQGEHMDMEINIIENTSPKSSRLSELGEMENNCLANTINFENNPSLCKSEIKSGITVGQGGVKCVVARALEEEGVKWSQDMTHKS